MTPLVRLVGADEEEPHVFIPFTRRIHDTKALEAALPELEKELAERWPVRKVQVRYRFPNPSPDTLAFMPGTPEGLVVLFLATATIAGGTQFGKDVGKQMARIVNHWLKRLEPKERKPRHSRKRSPR